MREFEVVNSHPDPEVIDSKHVIEISRSHI